MIWANGSVNNYGHGLFSLMMKYWGHFTFPTIIGKNHFLINMTLCTDHCIHRTEIDKVRQIWKQKNLSYTCYHDSIWLRTTLTFSLNLHSFCLTRPCRVHAPLHRLHHVRPRLHLHHHRDRQVRENFPYNDWVNNTLNCQHFLGRNLMSRINRKIIR